MKYYGKYNANGDYTGFYNTDIWKESDIPLDECIELTYDQWQEALTGKYKVDNGNHTKIVKTQQEIDDLLYAKLRAKRDKLLLESDWTVLTDNKLSDAKKNEWLTYRQALRDLTDTVDINNIVYPTKPS